MLAFYQRLSRTVCSRAISRKREFRIMLGVSRLEVAMFALLTAYPRGYVFVAERGSRDDDTETNVHRLGGDPCLSRTRVLGFGGFAAFFSQPALTALAIATFVISGISVFSGGNMSPGEREDRANRWVIVVFALIGLLSAYLPAYTDRTDFWTFDGETIRWLGVVLFTVGGALRLRPVFVLGHRFSRLVAIQSGHTLVTSGV